MPTNHDVKKETQKFDNFAKEEEWLMQMLQDGWILTDYTSDSMEEYCYYTFECIQHEEQKNGTYKIDYRSFYDEDDFEEYVSLFEETGWTAIQKKLSEPRRIFYINLQKDNLDIFSDTESYIEREKERMADALKNILLFTVLLIVAIILYNIFDHIAFLAVGSTFYIPTFLRSMFSYYKHRKTYKSLIAQQG